MLRLFDIALAVLGLLLLWPVTVEEGIARCFAAKG